MILIRKIKINQIVSVLIVLFVLTVQFIIYGCGNNNNQVSQVNTLDKIKNTKELKVGYFIFEPAIMEDPNTGSKSGIFIDMIELIAKSLDAKVVYHKVDLANFSAGLQSHQYDICIGATFATPQRSISVAFTRAIFYSGYTGVVLKGNNEQYTSWQSLDKSNYRIAVKQGSAIDDFVRENFKNAQIIRLAGPDLSLPLAAVSSGQADIGLMNQQTVFTYLRSHPETKEILQESPIAPTKFSWSVRPDDLILLNFINTCIEYMENTGDLYKIESKYGMPLMHEHRELIVPKQSLLEYWKTN